MLPHPHQALTAAVALLAGCGLQASDTPIETESDAQPDPIVSVVGDTAFLELPVGTPADNGELAMTFDGVSEDSRCPTGVQCVWEGNAGIRLTLTAGDETRVFIVNSALEPRWVSFAGYVVGYRDLRPYPLSEQPTDPGEYRATIAVVDSRKGSR